MKRKIKKEQIEEKVKDKKRIIEKGKKEINRKANKKIDRKIDKKINRKIIEYQIEKYSFIILPLLLLNIYYLYFSKNINYYNITFYSTLTIIYFLFLSAIILKEKKYVIELSLIITLTNILISIINLTINSLEKNLNFKEYNYHIIILFLSTTMIFVEFISSKIDMIKLKKIEL